jgi:glucan 1,3-beta-glucosidase
MVYGNDPNQPATDTFHIGIKNMIFVSTSVSTSTAFTLLDWCVSQATQVTNVKFDMPDNSQHIGMAMPEGGSGTMMGNFSLEVNTASNEQPTVSHQRYDV